MDTNLIIGNEEFNNWFKTKGGRVHPSVGITTFPSMGRGVIALQDIKKETILFTLPRSLTLSTRTSSLPSMFGEQDWKKFQLHKGWVGLILCMLWEDAAGENGKWSGYLNSLPDRFQTPMFWDDDDLEELQGTTILDKIGRADVERDYHEKVIPAVKSRPDLFSTGFVESHYSLHKYHVMGSRILSRSFHVERWERDVDGGNDDDDQSIVEVATKNEGMDVDAEDLEPAENVQKHAVEEYEDPDAEDEEDPSDVAMVPMADILNARYRSENARLCYDSEELQMICTREIQAGEQIWNTYGDPPNSDLLRKYGHVDLIPMAGGIQGNPADIVEIRADVILDVIRAETGLEGEELDRIEWWLNEGEDDIFILEMNFVLPERLLSFIRLLTMPRDEWERTQAKGKVPKPKADMTILRIVKAVLRKRIGVYKTTLEEDEALLLSTNEIGPRKHMAIVVRVGEKRILKGTHTEVLTVLAGEGNNSRKRRKENGNVDAYIPSKIMRH